MWLNLRRTCELLLPNHAIAQIRYFTAHVSPRPNKPQSPLNQQMYLRALRTLPEFTVHLGYFLCHPVSMPQANCPPGAQKYATVLKTEEKGSDVNLATYLMHDAYEHRFECAVVVTNDSDLLEPIRIVKDHLQLKVGVLNPHKHPSKQLLKHASFVKQIRAGVLAASQFPAILNDAQGPFHKPPAW
jgi:hypothetical protein